MTPAAEADVLDAALRFRRALEELATPRTISLKQFPRGSCGDVSEMLGQYLLDSGLGQWNYVMGYRSNGGGTHAWLVKDGWLIDITADQFEDFNEPVVVTRDSPWHRRWERGGAGRVADLNHFRHNNQPNPLADYLRLREAADELRTYLTGGLPPGPS